MHTRKHLFQSYAFLVGVGLYMGLRCLLAFVLAWSMLTVNGVTQVDLAS